jgi:hypothetical protein
LEDSMALPGSLPIPLPPAALARLLLGRAPRVPSSNIEVDGNQRIFEDDDGKQWVVSVGSQGQVEAWLGSDSREQVVSWTSEDGESVLVAEALDAEVRWKAVAREALHAMLVPLLVPEGYDEVDCSRDR